MSIFNEKSISNSSKHLLLEDPETSYAYALFAKNMRHINSLGRQACARRAGANKSLSNCSLKNPVAPSRNGARQRPAALKPGFNVLYFAQLAAGQSGQLERADCTRQAVCLLIFTADVDRARRASTVRDAPSFARIMFVF